MMRIFRNTYGIFKQVYTANSSSWELYQEIKSDKERKIWTGNSDFVYESFVGSQDYANYSASLEPQASTVISSDDALASIVGLKYIPESRQIEDNSLKVVSVGRQGEENIESTHNFCDRTTWFANSVPVVTQSLFNSGDNLTFSGSNQYWIDMIHGRVHHEDIYNAYGKYDIFVSVDGVSKVQRLNWETSGGDYTVNYESGSITFLQEQTGSVLCSYRYATNSTWILKPAQGKEIDIESAEAQFSTDAKFNDTIVFSVYGPVEYFAPQLTPVPFPAGTMIPLVVEKFKSMHQIIDEARGSYPGIPVIGGKRGMKNPIHGFPFRYGTVRSIKSSLKMELRVSLENDENFGGERATATFYNIVNNESA